MTQVFGNTFFLYFKKCVLLTYECSNEIMIKEMLNLMIKSSNANALDAMIDCFALCEGLRQVKHCIA
ncbi:hypothetical protein UFOVP646_18 [uncultured Caudovirales phage]|uniref:Uncharacterized protein n=1 Tax=uncultured Caudovirales phage TaxID=2100421 RepID=A0A6J5NAY2_9CAUD|nr:hypothetical protein UFOVP284_4 [uncultured Caudovirales phage]CAB4154611.1 hypothetical protein UFOVP646_18 [uncultured Caudovirales phage]